MSSTRMNIEPVYVLDTHALIWYLTNDKKLGQQAKEVFAAAERGETRLIISAVVVAEMYFANKKNRWFVDFNATYQQLRIKPYLRFIPFKAEHTLDFDVDASVSEMHDRIIVGLARRLRASLLTVDSQIMAVSSVPIIW
jgi:PIN domain nuclease of toxin-antitoxin system